MVLLLLCLRALEAPVPDSKWPDAHIMATTFQVFWHGHDCIAAWHIVDSLGVPRTLEATVWPFEGLLSVTGP
jgi:hypothetical protein